MKIIVVGATGFLGREVLRQALADPAITQVTAITRRDPGVSDPKLKCVVLSNFEDYTQFVFDDHVACIWCLGVSQIKVGEASYKRITLDYAMAAAKAMYAANPALRFCFVSSRSADPTEQRSSLQAKIKGRTERRLAQLGGPLFIFRPGYIRPTAHSGPRKDLGRLLAPIGALISLLGEDYSVDCDQFARCLLAIAKDGADHVLFLNREVRSWDLVAAS